MRRLLVLATVAFFACAPRNSEEGSTDEAVTALPHTNPVVNEDCPDPGVLREDDASGPIYTMVCTTDSPVDVFRIYQSRNLVSWTKTDKFVFPGHARHPWANANFWAPEIHKLPSGSYVVYYTARNTKSGRLCIGTATATNVLGPYTESTTPIVCHDNYGVIDPTYFLDDDGTTYLYWKDDGNDPDAEIQSALHGHTVIHGRKVSVDGLHLSGPESALIDHDLDWEGDLVEAPWMTKRNGTYYLFYSAFSYCDSRYAVGVATSSSPLGPFTKNPTGDPILSSGGKFDGPGHGSVVMGPANDALYLVYHAWNKGQTCNDDGAERRVLVDRIDWRSSMWPHIGNGHPSG